MRKSYPRSFKNLLNDSSQDSRNILFYIQKKTKFLLKLNYLLKLSLPKDVQPWCRVANLRKNIIILETVNSTWKNRLRYEQKKLLSLFYLRLKPSILFIKIIINSNLKKQTNTYLKK